MELKATASATSFKKGRRRSPHQQNMLPNVITTLANNATIQQISQAVEKDKDCQSYNLATVAFVIVRLAANPRYVLEHSKEAP